MYFHNLKYFEDWDAHIAVLESKLGSLSKKLNQAIAIVEEYHNQPRTITTGNYNRHPLRVARILVEEMDITNETVLLTALFHDLNEWSSYDIENLKDEFGEEVYQGIRTLTWDQKGSWADFVNSVAASGSTNLIAIKIADKLDNNRAIALSGTDEEKARASDKTTKIILPLVERLYPKLLGTYSEVLLRL